MNMNLNCPHCGYALEKVEADPMSHWYGDLWLCFNDDCSYYVHSLGKNPLPYRFYYDEKGNEGAMVVGADSFKDRIIDVMHPPKKDKKTLKPFVKYAGGKTQLISDIELVMPTNFKTYIEPFVGGGSLFLYLQPNKAIISDINCELINVYESLRTDVCSLINGLKEFSNTEEIFYDTRAKNPFSLGFIERAARTIYLNRTCFNGLYRQNSKGEFNVPFGRYKNPKILNEINLRNISEYLNSNYIEIYCADYKFILHKATKDDFVYIDPPYHVVDKTSFTKYHGNDFREEQQIELASEIKNLTTNGVKVLLSNSNTEFIRDLYSDLEIITVNANRRINSTGKGRGKEPIEVLIKNY